ncbi:MAG TPA: polyhydroxyalkanoate synthesis repressor PhaR [Motiliproteus sp.]
MIAVQAEEDTETLRVLRKYTNRRLYDTSKSCYITLEDVKQLVLDNVQFEVQDSKTGADLTRNILLQIISEQEGESAGMLTNQVLQQLIRFYGDSMQGMMRQYLEQSIGSFLSQQDRIREQMESMIDAANPLNMMNKFAGQNMAMWNMFSGSADEAAKAEKAAGVKEDAPAEADKKKGNA